MPPQKTLQGRSGLVVAAFLWAISWAVSPLGAQELALQRDYPGAGPFECPAPQEYVHPAPEAQTQAGQLASDAGQATILGDFDRAETVLARATDLDPASPYLAYRHARALEAVGAEDQAIQEYCRAISLGASEAGIVDGRDRLDVLYEIVRERISTRARSAFVSGLAQADATLYEDAAESFTVAVDEAPDWPAPIYNRAIVYEQLGLIQESISDYRRYLDLMPGEVDPLVVLVSARIGMLEGLVMLPTPSPGGALAIGVLLPGGGQYYSGRGRGGSMVLGAAAAAVATGILVKKVTVTCLTSVGAGDSCPPDQVIGEESERPYLVPALGAAAAVTLIGAIEAFVKARGRRNAAADEPGVSGVLEARGLQLAGPSATSRRGRVDVNLLGLRFR